MSPTFSKGCDLSADCPQSLDIASLGSYGPGVLKLVHRYVLRELLSPTLLGLVVFTFVLLLRELFDIINLVINRGASGWTVLQVFACHIPQVMALTIPMAILVGALMGFGRMATDREIMAMRTSGIHLFWLVSPALLLAFGLSLALGLLNMGFMPRLHTRLSDLTYQLVFQSITTLEPGRLYDEFSSGREEMNFTFEQTGDGEGQLRGVVIQMIHEDRERGQRLIHTVAERGTIAPDLDRRAVHIVLENGTTQVRSRAEQEAIRVVKFERLEQFIQPALRRMEDGQYQKPPSEMSFRELGEAAGASSDSDYRAELRAERLRRWVFPFAALAFTLIGIPFGIITKTSGKGLGLMFSFLLILVYFGLLEWGSAVAESGSALTPLAMWSPNVVLGSIGLGMLWWVARR